MAKSSTPWDAVFKEVVLLLFGQAGAAVTTEVEVGRLPRTIDGAAGAHLQVGGVEGRGLPLPCEGRGPGG